MVCDRRDVLSHEKRMVSTSTDYTHLDTIFRVPASISINDIDPLSSVEVIDSSFSINEPDCLRLFDVDWSPPDLVSRGLLIDDSLVLRRSSRLLAGRSRYSPGRRDCRTCLARLVSLNASDISRDVEKEALTRQEHLRTMKVPKDYR